jgi:hypothetical protein
VYKNDKPHMKTSNTHPRTEMALNQGYSRGQMHQWEAEYFIPGGSSGFCLFQVFGGDDNHATSAMIHTYNGQLSWYEDTAHALSGNIYNKWTRVNVIHDTKGRMTKIYVNG